MVSLGRHCGARHPAGRYKGAVESNTGSSTTREGIMVQDRPGKHEKKSKDVAVAEKCGQSNGAEECVWLRKRQRGCMLHDCCMAHLLLIGLSLCKERIVKFVCSGWRRFARHVPRGKEGSQGIAHSKLHVPEVLIPQ